MSDKDKALGTRNIKITPDKVYEIGGQAAMDRFWKIKNIPKGATIAGGDIYYFTKDEFRKLGLEME